MKRDPKIIGDKSHKFVNSGQQHEEVIGYVSANSNKALSRAALNR
jgi:hypothetical protein